jgi:hypothetical protein
MKHNIPNPHRDYLNDYLIYFKTEKGFELYYEAYALYFEQSPNQFRWTFPTFIRNPTGSERDKYLNLVKLKHRKEKIEDILDETPTT